MPKIKINIMFDAAYDFEQLRTDILQALKITSDYQHDDIVMFYDDDKQDIELDIFPNDLKDLSHSRHALRRAFEAIHSRI